MNNTNQHTNKNQNELGALWKKKRKTEKAEFTSTQMEF